MDSTLMDESGIPVLQNSEDIPVHSTPIKGEKVPLPSTRHVMQTLQSKSSTNPDFTASESLQSIYQNDLHPSVTGGNLHSQNVKGQKAFYVTKQDDKFKPPAADANIECNVNQNAQDLSNVDNLRPKSRDHLPPYITSKQQWKSDSSKLGHRSERAYSPNLGQRLDRPYSPKFGRTTQRSESPKMGQRSERVYSPTLGQRSDRPYSPKLGQTIQRSGSPKLGQRSERAYSPKLGQRSERPFSPKLGQTTKRPESPLLGQRSASPGVSQTNGRNDLEKGNEDKAYRFSNNGKEIREHGGETALKTNSRDQSYSRNRIAVHVRVPYSYTDTAGKTTSDKNAGEYHFSQHSSLLPQHSSSFSNPPPPQIESAAPLRKSLESSSYMQARHEDRAMLRAGSRFVAGGGLSKVDEIGDQEGQEQTRRRLSLESPLSSRLLQDMSLNRSSKQNVSLGELETSTLQKQRQEIQMLMSELKDRDRELSDMMSSHQQQLVAWENDKQRVATLDQKSSQYEEELRKKSSQLRTASSSLKTLKSREAKCRSELDSAKDKVDKLTNQNTSYQEQLNQLQMENGRLQEMVERLSSDVRRLEARDQELSTSLKLKEKDIASATTCMKDLSGRLQQLDLRCKELQDREKDAVREKVEWKHKHKVSVGEIQMLQDDLDSKKKLVAKLSEEHRSARQQLALVQKENGMRERCKGELIESMRVKQERTDTQLREIRQLYERQLKEVSTLQVQLETSKEIIQKQQSSMEEQQSNESYLHQRTSRLLDGSPDKSACHYLRSKSPTGQPVRYRDHRDHRESDTEIPGSPHQTQSSGYQSQLMENQTGSLSGGNQQPFNMHYTDLLQTQRLPTQLGNENQIWSAVENQSENAKTFVESDHPERIGKNSGNSNEYGKYSMSRSETRVPDYVPKVSQYSENNADKLPFSADFNASNENSPPNLSKPPVYPLISNSHRVSGDGHGMITEHVTNSQHDRKHQSQESHQNRVSVRESFDIPERLKQTDTQHSCHQIQSGIDQYMTKIESISIQEKTVEAFSSAAKQQLDRGNLSPKRRATNCDNVSPRERVSSINVSPKGKAASSGNLSSKERTTNNNSTFSEINQRSDLTSPPRHNGYVMQSNRIEHSIENSNLDCAKQYSGDKQSTNVNKVQEKQSNSDSASMNNVRGESSKMVAESVAEEMERRYTFENKLCSFLEELDDIDDSIWDNNAADDENTKKVPNLSQVDASPSSKLQKLLLESHLMIQSLEKSSDAPSHQVSPVVESTACTTEHEIQPVVSTSS